MFLTSLSQHFCVGRAYYDAIWEGVQNIKWLPPGQNEHSKMPNHITESRIYEGVYSFPAFATIFSGTNQVWRWLNVERALAATQAGMDVIPHKTA